jgi:hypothetical protein
MLKHAHVGLRLISEICGVSDSSIAEIRSGVTVRIRARTERAILQVDRQARSNGSLVPAKPTWKLIGELLDEGFTVEELARRLGYESGKLQFNRNLVTAKTELKVERLWKKTMEGS